MRILLVEDHLQMRTMLQEVLTEEGHQVHAAESVAEAEAILAGPQGCHAVISSVRLPGPGDGRQLAARAEAAGIPVMLITGHPEDIVALSANGVRHLAKPFALSELFGWLERIQNQPAKDWWSQGESNP